MLDCKQSFHSILESYPQTLKAQFGFSIPSLKQVPPGVFHPKPCFPVYKCTGAVSLLIECLGFRVVLVKFTFLSHEQEKLIYCTWKYRNFPVVMYHWRLFKYVENIVTKGATKWQPPLTDKTKPKGWAKVQM